jgi:hypothetical protein
VDERAWRLLLDTLKTCGEFHPVEATALDDYEKRSSFKLPTSYRHFCRVFGPGNLADWFEIAVPGFSGKAPTKHDLFTVGWQAHEHREWQEYSDDPQQYEQAVIFGSDCTAALFFWDLAERTDKQRNECAIYAVWRDWSRERVCGTFWEFAHICLHRSARTLYDEPPEIGFRAAWFGGRVKKTSKTEPRPLPPAWRTDTVVSLARQMSQSQDYSALPILADALQDGGCDNEYILDYCRSSDPIVGGGWVIDLVLGKE